MSIKISYNSAPGKLREAVDKANTWLGTPKLYDLIRTRMQPFSQSYPANLSPTVVADLLENATFTPLLREFKAMPTVGGRFVNKYPKVLWANLNAIGKYTVDTVAAMLVHMCVQLVSAASTEYTFSCDSIETDDYFETAPYWVQQQVRIHFCQTPFEKLARQYLVQVDTKSELALSKI